MLIEYHQRTFSFQVAHEICHTDFRRNGHQHVDMIRHQMPFQNLNPFIFAEALQNFFYTFTELCEDYFSSIFFVEVDLAVAFLVVVFLVVAFGRSFFSSEFLDDALETEVTVFVAFLVA